jgi:oligopeptide/dipeptide ABC transporter ATP-binding protein
LRDERNISFLYITHDLSTAYQIGDEIFMLYQGGVTETGDTVKVIENPKHPYVQELIGSIPVPDPTQKWDTDIVLPDDEVLRAQVDSGCRFYPRCPHHMDRCLEKYPSLYEIEPNHQAACYLYDKMPVAEIG